MRPAGILKAGLVVAALLGAVDIITLAELGSDEGPPVPVIAIQVVLGIVTLVGVWWAWHGRRSGVTAIVVTRVLSMLVGVPAFFGDDVPEWVPAVVAVFILITLVALGLIWAGVRQQRLSESGATEPRG